MDSIARISAIVLCGGQGTRMRAISGDTPKAMLDVAGRPFLTYLLNELINQGIDDAVLAVGYQHQQIIDYFGDQYKSLKLLYSIEDKPLGTGGALKAAYQRHKATIPHNERNLYLVLNGDTLVDYDLNNMCHTLYQMQSEMVMSIKYMLDTERYGRIQIKKDRIVEFSEKQQNTPGFINTGIYLMRESLMDKLPKQEVFSFEKAFLEPMATALHFSYFQSNGYFVDMGIPSDYQRINQEMGQSATA